MEQVLHCMRSFPLRCKRSLVFGWCKSFRNSVKAKNCTFMESVETLFVTYIGHYIGALYITYIGRYISALFNLSFMFIHCHKR